MLFQNLLKNTQYRNLIREFAETLKRHKQEIINSFTYIIDGDGKERSASFLKGFLLQLVNVKIYLFGITALTGYVTNYSTALPVLVFFEFVIATIGTVATSAWIGTGLAIQKVYLRHYRLINIILAVTLLECVYSILK